MVKVSAIVLNYNSAATIEQCLTSVFRTHDATEQIELSVIVVDNASTDGSLATVRSRFPRVEYIKNSHNIGFAAGNNVGIRFALERGADYVILINSDATVEPSTIPRLIASGESLKQPSVLSPHIVLPSGATWYCGAVIDYWRMRIVHKQEPCTKPIIATAAATGCVMSIHRDVFKKIGLLNESYFLYYEDSDFSLCARKAGFPIAVVPSARAMHFEVSENPKNKPLKTYWLVLSALLFFTAHAPRFFSLYYVILIAIRKWKSRIAPQNPRLAPHVRRAFSDFPTAKKHYVSHC